nr:hypothetical protein [Tanacetum cinerariifolium]
MNNKKRIVNVEYFREMLHICIRLSNQTFDELPFEEEILAFLRYLGHNEEIKKITDVNINKLHQPWRSFAAVINKCLNFVYQVEHKDAKKSNEMYYPRFTKVIIHFFMTKDPSIPRRNKFGAILRIELTNKDIRNSAAYKEYYVVASEAESPKTKASVKKTQSSSDTTITPPTAGTRLLTSTKGKQPAKSSKIKGLSVIFEKLSDEDDEVHDKSDDQEDENDQDDDDQKDDDQDDNDDDQDTDNDGDDFIHPRLSIHKEEAKDEECFDPIVQTPENSDDEGNDDASLGMNVGGEEGHDAKDDDEELYRDININLEGAVDDQPITEASQHPEWFQKQKKPLTLDCAWNKTLPATHENIQPWISDLAKQADSCTSFNKLMDTHVDFSAFLTNRLKVDTLNPELLAGPTYELMKGSCKSLVELEFFLKEVYKATIDQLDWNNPEGHQYPYNLLKPLPLIPNSRGRRVILFDHFINNDLEYLCSDASSRKYTTSVTKTKAADYRHIKWIEDLVPLTMWSQEPVSYDKYTLWGISHWGHKCQQFYGFAVNWKAEKSHGRKTLCFQRLSKNVHKKHRHPTACGRSLTRCQKLPKEAQPHKAGYNRLMRIDELHKFSNGTLNDVRTTLDDHLKGIRIKYLPQAIWGKCDKERAASMIQAIDKQLKTRRIMRSLEKFIGGRLYEGDFRILQRTI